MNGTTGSTILGQCAPHKFEDLSFILEINLLLALGRILHSNFKRIPLLMFIDGRSESPSAVDILIAVERLQRECFSVAPGRVAFVDAFGAGRKEKV
jgi:hypothetical protein